MESRAVCDTGPIMHLSEIELSRALDIFSRIIIPAEVLNELRRNKIPAGRAEVVKLNSQGKDNSYLFANEYFLDLGEAQAIALCVQEKADYFLTDDLEAREVAKRFKLEVHGTIGIILRAFREKILTKKEAVEKIRELQTKSSLFITSNLIEKILLEIENFKV